MDILLFNPDNHTTLFLKKVNEHFLRILTSSEINKFVLNEKIIGKLLQCDMLSQNNTNYVLKSNVKIRKSVDDKYFSSPHELMIETTKICNFKCIYCCAESDRYVYNNDNESFRLIIPPQIPIHIIC